MNLLRRLLTYLSASPGGVREDHDLIEAVSGRSSAPVRDDALAPLLVAWHDEYASDGA
jgi:hypothetical protein